ncbi:MAG: enoyl-CoA hydratase, partial [Hyphomicrobiales bacterium]
PDLIDALDRDPEILTVVLKGAGGKAFVAGADIAQFAETRDNAEQGRDYEDKNAQAFGAIRDCTKPTIAMIDGYCIGGGMAIALSCDLRIASEGSTFAIPAAKLGLAYPIAGMQQVLKAVHPAFAKEIFFTARQFDTEEALTMNLINRVVARDGLEQATRKICEQIARNAPLTLRAAKHAIDTMTARPESFDRAALETMTKACFDSEDYAEGRRAFLEKRKPEFHGE